MAPASAEGQSSWWIYKTKRHRIKLGSHKSNTTRWHQKNNKPESQTQPSGKLCFSSRMPWHSFVISYCLLPLKEKPLKLFFCLFLSFFLEQPLKLHRVSFLFLLQTALKWSYFPIYFLLSLDCHWSCPGYLLIPGVLCVTGITAILFSQHWSGSSLGIKRRL